MKETYRHLQVIWGSWPPVQSMITLIPISNILPTAPRVEPYLLVHPCFVLSHKGFTAAYKDRQKWKMEEKEKVKSQTGYVKWIVTICNDVNKWATCVVF